MELFPQYCLISILLFCLTILGIAVRVVPEEHALVIFRLGKFDRICSPGRAFHIPFIERDVLIDLREQVKEMTYEHTVRVGESVHLNLVCYYQILDPVKSLLSVINVDRVLEGMIITVLRREIGDMDAKGLRISREQIEGSLLEQANEKFEDIGVLLINIKISWIEDAKA